MKLAFFEMRADKLIAKIHMENTRSLKAFEHCGFLLESQTPTLKSFAMSAERYLRLLREGAANHAADIHITEFDKERLTSLLVFEHPRQFSNSSTRSSGPSSSSRVKCRRTSSR